jgi:hypothetical protein
VTSRSSYSETNTMKPATSFTAMAIIPHGVLTFKTIATAVVISKLPLRSPPEVAPCQTRPRSRDGI